MAYADVMRSVAGYEGPGQPHRSIIFTSRTVLSAWMCKDTFLKSKPLATSLSRLCKIISAANEESFATLTSERANVTECPWAIVAVRSNVGLTNESNSLDCITRDLGTRYFALSIPSVMIVTFVSPLGKDFNLDWALAHQYTQRSSYWTRKCSA